MDTVKIIGIKITPSSKNRGQFFYNYYYTSPFSAYDVDHAFDIQGLLCGVEFATVDIGCHIGDEVEFRYSKGYQDKAVLVGCVVVKPASEFISKSVSAPEPIPADASKPAPAPEPASKDSGKPSGK